VVSSGSSETVFLTRLLHAGGELSYLSQCRLAQLIDSVGKKTEQTCHCGEELNRALFFLRLTKVRSSLPKDKFRTVNKLYRFVFYFFEKSVHEILKGSSHQMRFA
jgi:hypothetical protein